MIPKLVEKQGTEKQPELLHGQTNAGEKSTGNQLFPKDGEELIKRRKVEGTPFEIIEAGSKCWIALGLFKVVDNLTVEEAERMIGERDWTLIGNMAACISETVTALLKNQNQ